VAVTMAACRVRIRHGGGRSRTGRIGFCYCGARAIESGFTFQDQADRDPTARDVDPTRETFKSGDHCAKAVDRGRRDVTTYHTQAATGRESPRQLDAQNRTLEFIRDSDVFPLLVVVQDASGRDRSFRGQVYEENVGRGRVSTRFGLSDRDYRQGSRRSVLRIVARGRVAVRSNGQIVTSDEMAGRASVEAGIARGGVPAASRDPGEKRCASTAAAWPPTMTWASRT
jgi:hypothetical protein